MLYAITDIETTGGYAASNGITEIAVYIHDGQQVVDSFETLVNPHQPIPRFVQSLTGITDEMVQLAPSFEEIAANTKTASCILDETNGDFVALILVKSFKFKAPLMEEHFNENYMESSKFPKATFNGKILTV